MKRLLASLLTTLLLATEAGGQGLTSVVPELFAHGDIPAGPSLNTTLPVVAQLATPQGRLNFVLHRDGAVGIAAEGREQWRIINALDKIYRASPLEMYLAHAPTGAQAPTALLQDHAARAQREPRMLPPQPRRLPRGSQLLALATVATHSGGPENWDPVCMNNWYPHWEAYVDPATGSSYWWNDHAWGFGSWDMGDANVSLGTSSAGRLMFCTPPETIAGEAPPVEQQNVQKPIKLTIQEYLPMVGWFNVMSVQSVTWGWVYGYHYRGFAVRKLRMTIREFPDRFWWGAAF